MREGDLLFGPRHPAQRSQHSRRPVDDLLALMIVVSLNYVVLIMRADNRARRNHGADRARALGDQGQPQWRVALLGSAFSARRCFYGDAVLTPAISSFPPSRPGSRHHAFKPYVVPIAVVVLVALFAFERAAPPPWASCSPGHADVVIALALSGLHGVAQAPRCSRPSIRPHPHLPEQPRRPLVHRARAVVLAVTARGVMPTWAFRKAPCASPGSAWWPALVLNYFGQGALLMVKPARCKIPFSCCFPAGPVPMVVLATRLLIASQAVNSGAYSLTKQAVQLGFLRA